MGARVSGGSLPCVWDYLAPGPFYTTLSDLDSNQEGCRHPRINSPPRCLLRFTEECTGSGECGHTVPAILLAASPPETPTRQPGIRRKDTSKTVVLRLAAPEGEVAEVGIEPFETSSRVMSPASYHCSTLHR
jgi:hypothetical protein